MIIKFITSRISTPLRLIQCLASYEHVGTCHLHTTGDTYKGHSHWQNIQRTKSAKDALKGRVALETTNAIRIAIMESGGIVDLKLNSKLAGAIEKGKKSGVTMVTMQRAINRYSNKGTSGGEASMFGWMGPGGCSFITVVQTDKPHVANNNIRSTLKKCGLKPNEAKGQAMRNFESKGLVEVLCAEGKGAEIEEEDRALEVAIEVGAEEVERGVDSEDNEVLVFICDVPSLQGVRQALEQAGYQVSSALVGLYPTSRVALSEEECDAMRHCFSKIYEHMEVVKIYDNIE